jgi:hypothetical protein
MCNKGSIYFQADGFSFFSFEEYLCQKADEHKLKQIEGYKANECGLQI